MSVFLCGSPAPTDLWEAPWIDFQERRLLLARLRSLGLGYRNYERLMFDRVVRSEEAITSVSAAELFLSWTFYICGAFTSHYPALFRQL